METTQVVHLRYPGRMPTTKQVSLRKRSKETKENREREEQRINRLWKDGLERINRNRCWLVGRRYDGTKGEAGMAFESHQKAAISIKNGWTKAEITPYETTVKDKDGNLTKVKVEIDDGCRPETTVEGLSKLKPAF